MPTPVMNQEQAIERLTGCERDIRALGVVRLALFGSVLRGDPRANSDVDVLVQFGPGAKSYDHFLKLSELLENRLGRSVELVTLEALSPFIGPRILAEAQDVLRAADYLRHILIEADYLIVQSKGLSYEAFFGDDTLRRAFVRSLEIIGQAAKKIPDEFRAVHPSIEWRAMAGMRDQFASILDA